MPRKIVKFVQTVAKTDVSDTSDTLLSRAFKKVSEAL